MAFKCVICGTTECRSFSILSDYCICGNCLEAAGGHKNFYNITQIPIDELKAKVDTNISNSTRDIKSNDNISLLDALKDALTEKKLIVCV